MASKGKGIAKDASPGKRKLRDDNNSSAARKRRDRSVLQFFEDVAPDFGGESDDSDFFDGFMEEDFETIPGFKNDDAKAQNIPFFPKEEEMNEEEFDRMMEEHYNQGPGYGAFAEENYENKNSTGRNPPLQSARDTISLWKVKCMVGRERQSVFCLMQKFVDLNSFGTKLQIKAAFCVEHVKGFIYIEAPRQYDLIEACKGISGIYSTRVASVPENDISQLLTVRSRVSEVAVGTMARVKNGKYKGDLAQIVAVNNARKRATVKLVPRIDLQAMAEKFGGGSAAKKISNPAPRLINSSELDEFRPLMQFRRDRETGKLFEFLDGMMLKDGYLYKKISLDSLNCWGVMPSEDELLKFKPPESNESHDLEWLSQLYGEKKKKKIIRTEKGGGKGEGSSGSSSTSSFGDHDLICFGRKDFGMILGMEKDDSYKILKDSPNGSVVVNVQRKELKGGSLDAKFTAADHNGKMISVSDNVKVLEGSLKDKQGIVKHVYRHTVFVYDENEVENDGYFCCKSNKCEKIKISYDAPSGKEDDKGFSGFEDFSSSPKSPLSPKKPWAEKETGHNRDDRGDGMFSIGQTLRIRVGPLKGYLCRVIAVRKRDVTVKLDSQQKVLTVRSDFLSEVQRKSSAVSLSEDPLKPFDILGNEGSSQDWMGGTGSSAGGDGWNSTGPSSEGNPWPSFPESSTLNGPGSSSTNPIGSESFDAKKDEDSPWVSKSTPDASTSWGAAKSSVDTANNGQASGWGKSDSWGKTIAKTCSDGNASGAWGKTAVPSGDSAGLTEHTWDKWDKGKQVSSDNQTGNWGDGTSGKNEHSAWSRDKDAESGGWKKTQSANFDDDKTPTESAGDWTNPEAENKVNPSGWNEGTSMKGSQTSNWGNQDETGGWGKPKNVGNGGSSAWNKSTSGDGAVENDSWNKPKLCSHDENIGKKGWGQSNEASDNGNKWQSSRSDGGTKWGTNESEHEGGKDKSDSSSLTTPRGDQSVGGWDKQRSSNDTKASEENSPWNKKSVESGKDGELKNQGSGWNVGKTSGGDSASGWGQASKEAGSSDLAGNWGSNWKKNSDVGNEDSSLAKKSNWSSGSGNSNWGEKSNWNSGNEYNANHSTGGAEAQTDVSNDTSGYGSWREENSDRGGYRGRGGFRGRGERGRFGGRGRSDRGGFGRGGFGGRGRGRWNSEGGSNGGDNKGWSSGGGGDNRGWSSGGGGGDDNKGWSSSGGGDDNKGWSSGGAGGGDNKGWSSGGGGDNKGWSSGGGGDNKGWSNGGGDNKGWSGGGGGGGSSRGRWSSGSGSNDGDREKFGSDRGGFRGRGRGRWNQEGGSHDGDNGGWRGGRGGYGGRGRGRWNQEGDSNDGDNGGGGGWSSGGGGGSWGKSGSDRGGGFGGRGSGKWNQEGGSNNNGRWSSGGGAGSWNQGGDEKNQPQSWKPSNDGGDKFGGQQGSGWKEPTSGNEPNNWKSSGSSGADHNSGWNKSTTGKEIEESDSQKNSWSQATKVDDAHGGGGWQKPTSGWNGGTENQTVKNDVNASAKDGGWGKPASGGGGGGSEKPTSSWNTEKPQGGGGGGWEKPTSSWNTEQPQGGGGLEKPPSSWNTEKPQGGGGGSEKPMSSWNTEQPQGGGEGGWVKPTSSWNTEQPQGGGEGGWVKPTSSWNTEQPQGGGGGWEKPTSSSNTEQPQGGGGGGAWSKSSSAEDGKSSSGWGR
ncbi:Protein RNA-directed DNA methylation 3 [Cucurbita argyrosperma subsp. argyrosperma]|nr:Protein RNA-directed DNA methylation 3 [Cucurbita argyrosperma subsp. argyrosperma]